MVLISNKNQVSNKAGCDLIKTKQGILTSKLSSYLLEISNDPFNLQSQRPIGC